MSCIALVLGIKNCAHTQPFPHILYVKAPYRVAFLRENYFVKRASTAVALTAAATLLTGQVTKQAIAEDIKAPAALFATVCWLTERGGLCNEVQLTPGAAGQVFPSLEACEAGRERAMNRWFEQAGPGLGITGRIGKDYRIEFERCGPPVVRGGA
jgi:hypothetical protein